METSPKVKFGSTFKAESQNIPVNCKAERVQDDAWVAGTFTINFGENWYYGLLKHVSEPEDPTTEILQYLIQDNVGHDGWGDIRIFRNIEWLNDDLPNLIQTHNYIPKW